MADFQITDDTKSRFGQFGQITSLLATLQGKFADINELNKVGGGLDDSYGEQYALEIDQPTSDLENMLTSVGKLLSTTGDNGATVSKGFDNLDDDARHVAEKASMG